MASLPNIKEEPQRLGRYETLFRLAAGGMAEVYVARALGAAGFEKLVAIKCMLSSVAEEDEFVNMFLDEGRIAANIDHPNVVSTVDLGRSEDGRLYIAMDLVVGVTVSRLLRNLVDSGEPFPPDLACELLAQAAAGLHAAHVAATPTGEPLQIVHRDVSPQNLLVGIDGRLRITDFGVARAMQRITQTTAGRFKGKFSYSAPEQLHGHEIDRRADVFSLGVVAWEMFARRRLFRAPTPAGTVTKVLTMDVPDLREINPLVPDEAAELIASMLQRDPLSRPQSAKIASQRFRAIVRDAGEVPGPERIRDFVIANGGEVLDETRQKIRESMSPGASSSQDLLLRFGSEAVGRNTHSHADTVLERSESQSADDKTKVDPDGSASFKDRDLVERDGEVVSHVVARPGVDAVKGGRGLSFIPWVIVMLALAIAVAIFIYSGDGGVEPASVAESAPVEEVPVATVDGEQEPAEPASVDAAVVETETSQADAPTKSGRRVISRSRNRARRVVAAPVMSAPVERAARPANPMRELVPSQMEASQQRRRPSGLLPSSSTAAEFRGMN